jgi:hypothetical protein
MRLSGRAGHVRTFGSFLRFRLNIFGDEKLLRPVVKGMYNHNINVRNFEASNFEIYNFEAYKKFGFRDSKNFEALKIRSSNFEGLQSFVH